MWTTIISYIPDWKTFCQAGLTLLITIAAYLMYKSLYSHLGSGRSNGAVNPVIQPPAQEKKAPSAPHPKPAGHHFTGDYSADLASVKQAIGGNSDVHFREFTMTGLNAKAALITVDGMQGDKLVNMQLMQMLMFEVKPAEEEPGALPLKSISTSWIQDRLLPLSPIIETQELEELNEAILFGHSALIIEGMNGGLLVSMPDGATRTIMEPVSESLLRGSRLGFTEVLSENTSMLRRQGLNEQLEMKTYRVGSRIQKDLVIAYIKDVVNPDLLQEVKDRISKIDMDFLAESGYVEQLIEDNYLSPFQQAQNTERPDRVISALVEGRIAILLDGTPFALIVPVTFSMLLQSPEDYYERWLPGTIFRVLRFLSAFMALMAPALYISFISFHPGLIPTELALSIIETRQGVPFPSLIEVLILEISIEILREAGIRLPKPIGPAMGIVGGIIIGDAAVKAGIVSPILVIVVAVTAISSFSIPMYSAGMTLRILRFAGMIFAAFLGMFGTILFFLLICSHLAKLTSFGMPYLSSVTPYRWGDWKDLFIRAPLALMKRRPAMLKTEDKKRRS